MKRCILDFNRQMGVKGDETAKLLLWVCGDGGSFATVSCLKKYLNVTDLDVYQTFHNHLATIEIWHVKSTNLNTMATNFYGPRTMKDVSTLFHSAAATNMHCPSNTQSCNFYPTAHSMQLFWEAHILNLWSILLTEHKDLLLFFEELELMPSLETLCAQVETLANRYASSVAYEQALSLEDSQFSREMFKIPFRKPWTSQSTGASHANVFPEAEDNEPPYKEIDNFDGDCILANSILFLWDFSWWMELVYTTADGDIGRAFAVLKV